MLLPVDINDSSVIKPVALVSIFGPPHSGLLNSSSMTYWTVQHLREAGTHVIDLKTIDAVVTMAPDPTYQKFYQDGTEVDRWYLTEKPGLKLSQMIGIEEDAVEE